MIMDNLKDMIYIFIVIPICGITIGVVLAYIVYRQTIHELIDSLKDIPKEDVVNIQTNLVSYFNDHRDDYAFNEICFSLEADGYIGKHTIFCLYEFLCSLNSCDEETEEWMQHIVLGDHRTKIVKVIGGAFDGTKDIRYY